MNFPYFYTCRWGELEIVKYLVEVQGCSAVCTDNRGVTPLHMACE
jgi:ankyrin repeat protein